MNIMERAIRIDCFQNLANYRKPSSFIIKESYPLPPYSTVIGMIHAISGFDSYHKMQVSIQGENAGSVSELYTRYSFKFDTKYEEGRHQLCIKGEDKDYGVFKGIAHVELICDNRMVLHIIPEEEDFDKIYQSLKCPIIYPSLGRYEDLLDIQNVEIIELQKVESATIQNNIYIPFQSELDIGRRTSTTYMLTKEYEITSQGYRRWKPDGGKIKVHYMPKDTSVVNAYVDTYGDVVAFA